MRNTYATLFFAATLALASCAQPEPEPIMAQPTYDKYGDLVSSSCPADVPYTSVDQQGRLVCLPECPPGDTTVSTVAGQIRCVPTRCPPGQQPAASTAAAGQVRCVPISRGSDDQPSGGRQPTGTGQGPLN